MVKKLKSFNFTEKRGDGHDWKKLSDGSIWELTHGIDFTCDVASFRCGAYAWAKRHGMKLNIRVTENTVILQMTKKES